MRHGRATRRRFRSARAWLAGCALAAFSSLAANAAQRFDVSLTTNTAPAGYVEFSGVEAGEFAPAMWEAGTLNLMPDLRFPLLAPLEGAWRNIYAPSAVEMPDGYRVFYGAWDGVPTGNDLLYSIDADVAFQDFANRRHVILNGGYIHVCNVNALRFDDGAFHMHATVYPVETLNKPAYFRSDSTGTNWNGAAGEPYTVRAEDLITISGYNYDAADINGMNVMLHEDGRFRLYFGDFKNFKGVFRASSKDGKHYTFETNVLSGAYAVNDVKKFRVGATAYYLMGLHLNGDRLWQSVSTNALSFPAPRPLLFHSNEEDRYIVALGWVVRGSQETPGRKVLGVLYGAGAVPSLDRNRIFARWLQKQIVLVTPEGERFSASHSLGPNRQLLNLSGPNAVTGRLELYAEDGVQLLGVSRPLTLTPRQSYSIQPPRAPEQR